MPFPGMGSAMLLMMSSDGYGQPEMVYSGKAMRSGRDVAAWRAWLARRIKFFSRPGFCDVRPACTVAMVMVGLDMVARGFGFGGKSDVEMMCFLWWKRCKLQTVLACVNGFCESNGVLLCKYSYSTYTIYISLVLYLNFVFSGLFLIPQNDGYRIVIFFQI